MKKTLLIAAAALAAGIMTSQAQVYSQNIVGYANVPTPNNGGNYLICVPFKIGVSNGANEVFTSLPDFSSVLIWNPNTLSYATFLADSSSATKWDDGNFNSVPAPILAVGQGFFVIPSAANVTNTFAGSIIINVGTTNTLTLPNNGGNYLVGSPVPYAGSVTNGSDSGGGLNLNALPDFSSVLIWDPNTLSYSTYLADSSSATKWDDGNFNAVLAPSLTVGQGFFIIPSAANATWKQGL